MGVAEESWRLNTERMSSEVLKKKEGREMNGQPQRIFMSLRSMYCAFAKGKGDSTYIYPLDPGLDVPVLPCNQQVPIQT